MCYPLRACVVAACALWFCSAGAEAAVKLDIKGLNSEQRENVRVLAGNLPDDNPRAVRRFVRDLEEQTRIALSALGYFAADISIDTETVFSANGATENNPDGRDVLITVNAIANEPVRVSQRNIQITGPAKDDVGFMNAIPELPLNPGDVFLSEDYESIKTALLEVAQNFGYFDLEFAVSRVNVSRRNLTADIDLVVNSGDRYTFGKVLYDQDAFTREFLDRWLTFERGESFDIGKVGELTANLRNSGYFNSVRVIPQRDDRFGTEVPVRVSMAKKDDNLIGVGIGFTTDVGPRLSLSWEKPLINRHGHAASVDFQVSEPQQSIGFEYRIPREEKPLTNFWSFEAGLLNVDNDDDTASFNSTMAVQRVSRTTHDFTQSLFLRWERETSTISDEEDTVNLVLPGVSYTRTRSKGNPFLTWGQSESVSVFGGTDDFLSTIDFFKATANLRYVRSFWDNSSFIGSIGLGWIEASDFDRVPQTQRFFAGGDRSVRGFQYRDISPRNLEGDAVGGRYLEEFSVEYNYRLFDFWRAAAFVDAGRAFNNYDAPYSVGAGVGVRWESPVGPFRLDVATPVSDNDGGAVRVHLSLGPDL